MTKMQPQLLCAASIAAMSVFLIVIIASNACLATAGFGIGDLFRQGERRNLPDNPCLTSRQPHALSARRSDASRYGPSEVNDQALS